MVLGFIMSVTLITWLHENRVLATMAIIGIPVVIMFCVMLLTLSSRRRKKRMLPVCPSCKALFYSEDIKIVITSDRCPRCGMLILEG